MTEGKGKYGNLLSEIRSKQTQQPPTVLLPESADTHREAQLRWLETEVRAA